MYLQKMSLVSISSSMLQELLIEVTKSSVKEQISYWKSSFSHFQAKDIVDRSDANFWFLRLIAIVFSYTARYRLGQKVVTEKFHAMGNN